MTELTQALQVPLRHAGEDCRIVSASIRMTKRMTGRYVRVRSNLNVDQFSVRVVFPDRLYSLLVACDAFIRGHQRQPDFIVFHNFMDLVSEQSRPFPIGWKPEFETSQPRISSTICVLEHPIAEPPGPA